MTSDASPRALAGRIRGILGGQDSGVIEATARRLGVSELSLRLSIDESEPHPTVEVLLALVRHYGVDPTWLLTGEYDANVHRAALEQEAEFTSRALARLIATRFPTPSNGSDAGMRLEA